MKKSLIYVAALALGVAGTLASCSDFLDRPAQGQRTKDDFLTDPNATSGLTNSIYEVYRVSDTYASIGLWIPDLASDNALRGSSMSDGGGTIYTNGVNQFQNLSGLNGSSGFLDWAWKDYAYKGIGRANEVIRALDEFPDMPARQREVIEAEAKFNRAWFYFFVLKMWGKGPIVPLDELTGAEMADLDIASAATLYDYIVADLEFALKMPDKAESGDWFDTQWYGRAHKGSAQGLLAKVLLYRASDDPARASQHLARVVELVKAMEASTDGYNLTDINSLWVDAGEYSAESVFEIGVESFPGKNGSFQGWQLVGTRGTPNWGWGFIAPSLDLVQAFDPADKRAEWTIIYGQTTPYSGMMQTPTVVDNETVTGAVSPTTPTGNGYPNRFIRKFHQPRPVVGGNENYGGNIRLMRWAEVLLIGAEAALETGDPKAQEWLDKVRTRAGLPSVAPTPEAIWEEKRLEMAMECDRWFDLVRIDKKQAGYLSQKFWNKVRVENEGLEWMKTNHPEITPAETALPVPPANPVVTPKHYVMPVPEQQILLMNKLTQNTDY
jgi:hypothetical protein